MTSLNDISIHLDSASRITEHAAEIWEVAKQHQNVV